MRNLRSRAATVSPAIIPSFQRCPVSPLSFRPLMSRRLHRKSTRAQPCRRSTAAPIPTARDAFFIGPFVVTRTRVRSRTKRRSRDPAIQGRKLLDLQTKAVVASLPRNSAACSRWRCPTRRLLPTTHRCLYRCNSCVPCGGTAT
jgi:hypothetical protein